MNKFLSFILTLAVIILASAYYVSNEDVAQTNKNTRFFLPDLSKNIEKVSKLQIQHDLDKVTFIKENNIWLIKEANNFYAKNQKVSQVLFDLSRLKILEEKTKDTNKYSHLGLEYITDKPDKATLITITNDKGKESKIYLGNKTHRGIYARLGNNNQSWKLEGITNVLADIDSYKKIEYALLDEQKVVKISFDKNKVSIDKNTSNEWVSFKALEQRKVGDFIKSLTKIKVLDYVKKSSKHKSKPFVSFELNNKTTISANIVKINNKYLFDIKGTNIDIFDKWYLQIEHIDSIRATKFKSLLLKK